MLNGRGVALGSGSGVVIRDSSLDPPFRFLRRYLPPSKLPQKSIAIPAIGPNLQLVARIDRKVYVPAMDTQLSTAYLRIERKQFTFDLKENPQGTFLRITEEVSGRRNSIVIPATGLELFRDSLNEVIKFNKTTLGSGTVLSLGRRNAEPPTPDGSADLTMGS